MNPVYADPALLAKAIREARGTMSQQALAEWLGRDKKTVGRWEKGDLSSLGDTLEKRRAIAILVAEATGRRDLLGLSEPEPNEVERLEQLLGETIQAVTEQSAELVDLRSAQEETLKRIERLEHGGEGTGT